MYRRIVKDTACPYVVATSTFLEDIEALAKYRTAKFRLVELRGKVLLGAVGKEEISIPRRFRIFHPVVPTYEMLKGNWPAK